MNITKYKFNNTLDANYDLSKYKSSWHFLYPRVNIGNKEFAENPWPGTINQMILIHKYNINKKYEKT